MVRRAADVVHAGIPGLRERLEGDAAGAGEVGVDELADELFVGVMQPWVRQSQRGSQPAENLGVGQALPNGLDRWQVQREIVMAVRGMDIEVLGLHRGR